MGTVSIGNRDLITISTDWWLVVVLTFHKKSRNLWWRELTDCILVTKTAIPNLRDIGCFGNMS